MRGLIQIPIIVIILLISGGSIIVYTKLHKNPTPVTNQTDEATASAKEATASSETSQAPRRSPTPKPTTKPFSTTTPTPKSSTSYIPSPTSSFKSSSATVILSPSFGSPTPNGSGQVSVELYANDPYDTTGKIASFKINGSAAGLTPNTEYKVLFSPPNDYGGGPILTTFNTNNSGSGSFSQSNKAVSYAPVGPKWTIVIYSGNNSLQSSLKGSFSISNDIISAIDPFNPPTSPTPTPAPMVSATVTLAPSSGSDIPQASGNATVEILENGFIFEARAHGNITGLRPNTAYHVYLSRNDGNSNVLTQVQTDANGAASFSGSGATRNGGPKITSVSIGISETDKYAPVLSAELTF